jgi:hypothetical protein
MAISEIQEKKGQEANTHLNESTKEGRCLCFQKNYISKPNPIKYHGHKII